MISVHNFFYSLNDRTVIFIQKIIKNKNSNNQTKLDIVKKIFF